MTKYFLIALCIFGVSCTSNDVDNSTLTSTDSSSRKSIDSSAIINEDSRLPADSSKTTVTH